MKIRQSHVTNSSSSSFIVVFPDEKPKSEEEITKLLYGEDKIVYYEYNDDERNISWPATELGKTVFEDLKKERPQELTAENIAKELVRGYGPWSILYSPPGTYYSLEEEEKAIETILGMKRPKYPGAKATKEELYEDQVLVKKYYERQDQVENELAIKWAQEWLDKNKEKLKGTKLFYIFEYSDDSLIGTQLEHGHTFKNLLHIRISKH